MLLRWWGVDGHFSKGMSLHWFSGGGEPSMQQPINDTVRGLQGPGSRLANDYSDLELEWGEVRESGESEKISQ